MQKKIVKAKQKVVEKYEHGKTTERQWLQASVDSYDNSEYRVELFVLEGSPAKGLVIVNWGARWIKAIDLWGNQLYTWK